MALEETGPNSKPMNMVPRAIPVGMLEAGRCLALSFKLSVPGLRFSAFLIAEARLRALGASVK